MSSNAKQGGERTSVAWFALSNLIARKEKEKALNVFRLLAHSFDDRAYTLQIEGDILWHLDDYDQSIERYKKAAFLYQKEKRLINAIAIYEHMLSMNEHNDEILAQLIYFYLLADLQDKFEQRFELLAQRQSKHQFDEQVLLKFAKLIAETLNTPEREQTRAWAIQTMKKVCQHHAPDLMQHFLQNH
ncbi:MAG: hypothetical protein H6679_04445 [Epsilonproteobacteria bacterium]|nr:hypothetical protein [Campylobacterota bacterium]